MKPHFLAIVNIFITREHQCGDLIESEVLNVLELVT